MKNRTETFGDAILYLGDCLEVMAGLKDGAVDAVVTDIPYNISQEHGGLREIDYGDWDKLFEWEPSWNHIKRLSNRWIIWCAYEQVSGLIVEMQKKGPSRLLCWVKPNPTVMNGQHHWLPGSAVCASGKKAGEYFGLKCHKGWWNCPPDLDRKHPNQKPLVIITVQVEAYARVGETILDPFMGSGTTGVACMNLGRKFIGIEIVEKHFNIACRRIELAAMQERLPFEERAKPKQETIEGI